MAKKKSVRKSPSKAPKKKAVKKIPAKRAPKKAAVQPRPADTQQASWLPYLLLVIGLIIVIVGAIMLWPEQSESQVAATVNGVEITTEQLNTQYAILPAEYRAVYSRDMILDQLINEELLLAYTRKQGVSVTDEEVQQEIQQILSSGALTITELQQNLEQFNLTTQDFENLIERKLIIERGMDLLLVNMQLVADEDVIAYYETNQEQFLEPEQMRVRHILIASQRENAAQLGKDLKEQVESGADFCELVEEESDDKGSLETCGEYTFPRGYMVPEFEEASFDMSVGDVTLIQSQFGYHVIEKLEEISENQLELAEVSEQIRSVLEQQARVDAYENFIAEQKAQSDIQIMI